MKQMRLWFTCLSGIILLFEAGFSCLQPKKTNACESCSSVRFDTSQVRADSLFKVLNCGYRPFGSFKINSESYVHFDSVFCLKTLFRDGEDSLILHEPLDVEQVTNQLVVKIKSLDFAEGVDEKVMKEGWVQVVSIGGSPYFSIGSDWTDFYVTRVDNIFILSTSQRGATGSSASYCWNFMFEKLPNAITVFKPVCEDQRSVLFLR